MSLIQTIRATVSDDKVGESVSAMILSYWSGCQTLVSYMNEVIHLYLSKSFDPSFYFIFYWNKWNEISLPRRKNTSLPGPCVWQGKTNKHTSHSSVEMKKSCSRKPAQVQRFQSRGRTDPPQGATACLFWPDLHSPSRSLSWALPECQSFQ